MVCIYKPSIHKPCIYKPYKVHLKEESKQNKTKQKINNNKNNQTTTAKQTCCSYCFLAKLIGAARRCFGPNLNFGSIQNRYLLLCPNLKIVAMPFNPFQQGKGNNSMVVEIGISSQLLNYSFHRNMSV